MTHASLARTSLGNAVAWAATMVGAFVVTALIFRGSGDAEYGLWATVMSLRAILMVLDGGLTLGVTRDAALQDSEPEHAARIRAAWRLYGTLAAVALVLGLLGAGLPGALLGVEEPGRDAARWVTLLVTGEAVVALLGAPLPGILRGRQRFGVLAAANTAQALLGIAAIALVLDRHGLVGAAGALLAARIVATGCLAAWMRWAGLLRFPAAERRVGMGAVAAFAMPLWVSAVGAWLGTIADVPLVGALFGSEAAGHCALGSRLAGACAGLLFAVLGAAFPRFVTARRGRRNEQAGAVLFLGCTLAAAGFGLVIACSEPILVLWLGAAPTLAVQVLTLYALVWAVNTPAHVLSSLAVAAGRHRVLQVTTSCAVPVNVLLSVSLAFGGLPQGPAVASLVTILLSNWLLLPWLVLSRLELRWRDWVRPSAAGYLAGAGVAGVATLAVNAVGGTVSALGWGIGLTLTLTAVVLDLTVRRRSTLRLLWVRTVRGGWRVLARQRAESRRMRSVLGAHRAARSQSSEPPLVTVRIATYNRGRLVAERALASAVRQTWPNLEILVVGDCCDEATAAAVRSVDDARIRFVNLPERGRYPEDPLLRWMVAGAAPMNHALEIARGQWIAPLDDDDEFTPDHVEVLVRECQERGLDMVYGVAEQELEDGSWERCGAWPLRRGGVCHSAVLYSAALTEMRHDADSWRLDDPGDWNLWSRFRAAGARIGFVDRVVVRHYRERRHVREAAPFWSAAAVRDGAGAGAPVSGPAG